MTHLRVHGSPLCSLRWKCLASVSISSPSPHYSMLFALSLNTEAKDHTHAFPASFSPPTGGQSFKYFLYNRQPPKCQFRSPACALVRLQPHIQKPCLQTLEPKASDHSQGYRGLKLSSDLKQHQRLPGSLQYGFWRFQECLFGNRLWNSVYL